MRGTRHLVCLATLIVVATLPAADSLEQQFAFDDFLLAPLRVHLVSATNVPAWHTTLAESDVTRILAKVNRIWAQAGMQFYLESLVREEAAQQDCLGKFSARKDLRWLLQILPEQSCAERMFHVCFIHEMPHNGIYFPEAMFVKDTAALKKVDGGLDEPLPRVTSHELGHALTLVHRAALTNLMAPGTAGWRLNAPEIEQARRAARTRDWVRSAPVVLQEAERLFRAGKRSEAGTLYQALAGIPVKSKTVAQAQKRAQQCRAN